MGLSSLAYLACAVFAAETPPPGAPAKALKEAARREKFFSEAKSPVSRENAAGWLFGSYLRWDQGKGEYRQEHMVLAGESGKLVPFSWPMGEEREGRLKEVRSSLPAEAKRYGRPRFSKTEIVFSGKDGSRWRIRKYGEDLVLKVERAGSEPGYAVLTEKMAPP